MPIMFINEWLAGDFIRALSRTLIHSLWQGFAAAIIVGLIILCTKRSTAGLRYNLVSAVFILFIVTTVITFFSEYSSKTYIAPEARNIIPANNYFTDVADTTAQINEGESKNFIDSFVTYFDANAPLIVLIWFVIFIVQCLKLFSGFYYIQNIRRRQLTAVPGYWQEKLQDLSATLGIKQSIIFLQSEIVKVPVVLGYLKPTILVPIGLLAKLPPEQVETILLHELAHIRRKDYLVNLMQSVAETIFFFNPAIKWISAIIREEREACCDDIVVANTINKTTYLQALVSFHDHSLNKNEYAMALGSNQTSLLNRVKRLLTYENNKLNIMEKLFLVSGLVVFTAFGIANTKEKPVTSTPVVLTAPMAVIKPVSATPVETTSFIATPKLVKTPAVKNKIAVPVVLKDTVPKTTYSHVYSNINDDGTTKTSDIKVKDDSGKNYRIRKVNDKITEFYVNDVLIAESEMSAYKGVLDEIEVMIKRNQELSAKRREESKIRQEEARKKREEMRSRNLENNEKRREVQRLRQEEVRERTNATIKNSNEIRKKNIERDREVKEKRKRMNVNQKKNTVIRNEVSSIVNELIREKVISSDENISFTLDNNALTVNGAKQSTELHQKLKQKFINKEGDRISYSKSGNSSTTSINRN